MRYRVYYEGFVIVEADSEEEALNEADSFYDYYEEWEYKKAEKMEEYEELF